MSSPAHLLLLSLFSCAHEGPHAATVEGTGATGDTGSEPRATDTSAPPVHLVVDVDTEPGQPHLLVLIATLDRPAEVAAVCRGRDDPAETLLFESALHTDHRLVLVGLLEDVTYDCTVGAFIEDLEGARATLTLAGPAYPVDVPRLELTVPGPVGATGWTLMNDQDECGGGGSQWVFLVDRMGRLRWVHEVGRGYEIDIDASWAGDRFHLGGGWALFDESEPHRGLVRQVDREGGVLLERETPAKGLGFNHHSEVLDDGTMLSLTTHPHDVDGHAWYGVAIEKWDPASESVVWSWDTEQAVASGRLSPPRAGIESPWHANALDWVRDPLGDAVWVSTYVSQALWRVDRSTGEITHILGARGDFELVDAAGAPLPPSGWFYGQHDPEVTADGRVLLYDNGVGRPGGSQSRVAEYQLDLEARTATPLWSWTEADWWTPFIGDADYLPDGHVLINKGFIRCVTPWLFGQRSGVIELDPSAPSGPEVVWRLDWPDTHGSAFRAERYDGCEILDHGASCPQVADRIDQLGL